MCLWVLFSPGLSVMVGRSTRGSWDQAKELVKGKVVTKIVDEMWTYLYRNTRTFYKWVSTCYAYTKMGAYII
ncbi:ORF in transposon ISC1173 [Saccharolobus solfataricus]|uniref:ORF in transposon ISC1173 n=1 Tax=Saccharolobus solfataricus TaxID=2287 RepID=A0A157SY33_SACSO|nr:ORF in transposon ISC1173 [Saccharolobus solfataricus]